MTARGQALAEGKKARSPADNVGVLCNDAIAEVLRRLPARMLATCRLVCKSWRSVISNTHFVHEHLSRSPPRVLLFATDHGNSRSIVHVLGEDDMPENNLSRLTESQSLFVHNTCNGLLCLGVNRGTVELLNPTMGESLVLPMPANTSGGSRFSPSNWHCLGFCASTKEYKVAHFYPGSLVGSRNIQCEIFTVGTGAWRQIGRFDHAPADRGVHVNGVVYYLTKFRYIASSLIGCLDLESEELKVMPLPRTNFYGAQCCSTAELEGRLCLLVFDAPFEAAPGTMDILVLDDYDKQSWTHRYHMSLPQLMSSCYFAPKHILVHGGKIWVQLSGRSIYFCDPSSNADEQFKEEFQEYGLPFSAHAFLESLVPLHQHYLVA